MKAWAYTQTHKPYIVNLQLRALLWLLQITTQAKGDPYGLGRPVPFVACNFEPWLNVTSLNWFDTDPRGLNPKS